MVWREGVTGMERGVVWREGSKGWYGEKGVRGGMERRG